jgi:aminoglycoside phosphotransferase (APT) family kinase protein
VTDELDPGLRSWVEAETGHAVMSAAPIGSGASRRIWCIGLADGDEVVARVDSGDGPVAGTALTLEREADVYRALAPTALVIPALRAVHPDGTALLVDRAPGGDGVDGLGDDERRSVAEDYGRCLAQLHLLEPAELELGALALPAGADPTAADVELWRSIDAARSGQRSSPSARIALEVLARTVPEPSTVALCHGDAGPGNFLHEHGRVTALLDWEFAHLGDPHDDLAWVSVRNQLLGHPLDLPTTYAAWRTATQQPIDLHRLEWFRALVLTRMLVSCEAALAWAGPDAATTQVHATLHPFLALAVFEALRRGGCPDPDGGASEAAARAAWEPSLIASLIADPTELDDLSFVS